MMDVQLQQDYQDDALPIDDELVRKIACAVMSFLADDGDDDGYYEMGVACVDEQASRHLNHTYRHKDKATNVLSFESQMSDDVSRMIGSKPLGDLVVCIPIVIEEAQAQHKSALHHFSHLIVHGMLHLFGYDHETCEDDAKQMEQLEIDILAKLSIQNPYEDIEFE